MVRLRKKATGWLVLILVVMAGIAPASSVPRAREPVLADAGGDAVILVHGLGRTQRSMRRIQRDLQQCGYAVVNVGYPSLKWSIETAADRAVGPIVEACRSAGYRRIHFVTHSMGGIVVRHFLQDHELPEGSRVVMLAPPNSGSEMMDWAQTRIRLFDQLAGPAAAELVTSSKALHRRLKPVSASVGVIAGRCSWNPFFSAIIPGEDDGKVAVRRTRLGEMKDFIVLQANHASILVDAQVLRQIAEFLQAGKFNHRDVHLSYPQ